MSNLLQKGSTMLHRTRAEKLSTAVEYRRGLTVIATTATVGFNRFERNDNGVITLFTSRDYTFKREDLAGLSDPPEPRPGDVIAESIAGTTKLFQAVDGGAQGCFRREGLQDEMIRVHTTESGVEP